MLRLTVLGIQSLTQVHLKKLKQQNNFVHLKNVNLTKKKKLEPGASIGFLCYVYMDVTCKHKQKVRRKY